MFRMAASDDSDKLKPIWLKPSLGPRKTQNTVRVDEQNKDNFCYKHAFCREIIPA